MDASRQFDSLPHSLSPAPSASPSLLSHLDILGMSRFTFEQRAKVAVNAVSQRLFELMVRKKSNLALAADVPSSQQLLTLAEQVCVMLKRQVGHGV